MDNLLAYIDKMSMSYSYKPVLILAVIEQGGKCSISDAVNFFASFYSKRIHYGLIAERENSIFSHVVCDPEQIRKNIVSNPVAALCKTGPFKYENGIISTDCSLYNKDALIQACYDRLNVYYSSIGRIPNIRCFHKPEEANGYLSNEYLSAFSSAGVHYSSVEQFIAHYKALMFDDAIAAEKILKTEDISQIRQVEQNVRHFNDRIWNGSRQVIAYKGVLCKFSQNPQIQSMLIHTDNDILAECSASDTVWGIGLSMQDAERHNMDFWKGQNLLGYTLMQVRTELATNSKIRIARGSY